MQSTFTKIIFIYFIFLSLPLFGQKKDLFKQLAPLTVQDELLENENSKTYQNAISGLKTSEHSKKQKKISQKSIQCT